MKFDINNIDTKELFAKAINEYNDSTNNNVKELNDDLPNNSSVNDIKGIEHSIAVVVYSDHYNTPYIKVTLHLRLEEYPVFYGEYHLLLDEKMDFIDDFLTYS